MSRTTRRVLVIAVAVALIAVGCGSSSSNGEAKSFLRTKKGEGMWPNMPDTVLYESILDFPQPEGEKAPSVAGHEHPPGFVVGLSGDARKQLDGGKVLDVFPGDVMFAKPFIHHYHENPGPGPNDWLAFLVRPASVRDQPLPGSTAKVVFNSDDLPKFAPGSNLMLRLDEFTVRPGGQSGVTKQSGPTLVYSLEGEVRMHQQSQSPSTLQWGKTAFVPKGGVFQVKNPFKGQAKLLVLTVWEDGQPPDTPVSSASF